MRLVRKVPLTREARGHVRRMAENFRLLTELYRDTRFRPNRMVMDQDAAVFEYLEGETLEERFDRTYQGMQSGLAEALISFLREIDRTADGVFEITEEFRRVFGDAKPGEGLPSCSAANIDMVLNNIIADGDTWNVIDYEWTFPFSVPVAFIKWRIITSAAIRSVFSLTMPISLGRPAFHRRKRRSSGRWRTHSRLI